MKRQKSVQSEVKCAELPKTSWELILSFTDVRSHLIGMQVNRLLRSASLMPQSWSPNLKISKCCMFRLNASTRPMFSRFTNSIELSLDKHQLHDHAVRHPEQVFCWTEDTQQSKMDTDQQRALVSACPNLAKIVLDVYDCCGLYSQEGIYVTPHLDGLLTGGLPQQCELELAGTAVECTKELLNWKTIRIRDVAQFDRPLPIKSDTIVIGPGIRMFSPTCLEHIVCRELVLKFDNRTLAYLNRPMQADDTHRCDTLRLDGVQQWAHLRVALLLVQSMNPRRVFLELFTLDTARVVDEVLDFFPVAVQTSVTIVMSNPHEDDVIKEGTRLRKIVSLFGPGSEIRIESLGKPAMKIVA